MSQADRERSVNVGTPIAAPRLSILAPFYRDDPSSLLRALSQAPHASGVELILLNDGGGDAALLSRVIQAAETLAMPVEIIVWADNHGRARARNRLARAARGEYALFLDADMLPDAPDFLARWLDLIETPRPAIAYGGFRVAAAPDSSHRVHHALTQKSDCLDAHARAQNPALFTATSNLLVRRDLMLQTPFDEAFTGWGWEDVDWALSAARKAAITHVDIPAIHRGLDEVDTLLRKYTEAGVNYARLAAKHPAAVRRLSSFRWTNALRRAPARDAIKSTLAWVARDPFGLTPVPARCAALKLYRATISAEALS